MPPGLSQAPDPAGETAEINQEVVDSSYALAEVMVNPINQAPAANNPLADKIKALEQSLEHDIKSNNDHDQKNDDQEHNKNTQRPE